MSLHLFAGLRVRDFQAARAWYDRLFGEPTFFPHATEAVWTLAEHRSVYVVEHGDRAGNSEVTVFVDDLDAHVAAIAARGLEPDEQLTYSNGVRKALYRDPDGTSWDSAARRSTPVHSRPGLPSPPRDYRAALLLGVLHADWREVRVAGTAVDQKRGTVAELVGKRFESPDEVRQFTDGKGRVELVDLNGHAVGLGTFEPGWRWSENVKPLAGTDSCQVDHIGYVLQGRMALKMDDGTEREFGPGDTFHMPPGHDAWIVGEEKCVLLDFGGLKGYATGS